MKHVTTILVCDYCGKPSGPIETQIEVGITSLRIGESMYDFCIGCKVYLMDKLAGKGILCQPPVQIGGSLSDMYGPAYGLAGSTGKSYGGVCGGNQPKQNI